jgi:hypothetical protein
VLLERWRIYSGVAQWTAIAASGTARHGVTIRALQRKNWSAMGPMKNTLVDTADGGAMGEFQDAGRRSPLPLPHRRSSTACFHLTRARCRALPHDIHRRLLQRHSTLGRSASVLLPLEASLRKPHLQPRCSPCLFS